MQRHFLGQNCSLVSSLGGRFPNELCTSQPFWKYLKKYHTLSLASRKRNLISLDFKTPSTSQLPPCESSLEAPQPIITCAEKSRAGEMPHLAASRGHFFTSLAFMRRKIEFGAESYESRTRAGGKLLWETFPLSRSKRKVRRVERASPSTGSSWNVRKKTRFYRPGRRR